MTATYTDPLIFAEALALVCGTYSALDVGDADAVVACFAENGAWHRADGVKTGPDAIRAVVTNRPPDQVTAHCVSNLRVRSEEDGLSALYYLNVYGAAPDAPPRLVSILDCRDELVQSAAGLRIRVKTTRARMKFVA